MKRGRRGGRRAVWAGLVLLCIVAFLWGRSHPSVQAPTIGGTRYTDHEATISSSASRGSRESGAAGAAAGDSPLAPGAFPRLSKELAWGHARDGIIFVSWTNGHLVDFAFNWAASLAAVGVTNYLIGAMDAQAAEALAAAGVPMFAMFEQGANSTGLTSAELVWSGPTFHAMGRQKVALAAAVTGFGLELCLCDADTAWMANPTPFFKSAAAADVLSSVDHFVATQPPGDAGLEAWRVMDYMGNNLNIGMLLFRPSPATAAFLGAWTAALAADAELWDQDAFNTLVHRGELQPHPAHNRLALGFGGTLAVGVLPVASFATGHTFFVQNMYERQRLKPYVVHVTFVYGGIPAKRHRLREAGLWRDSDAYYTSGRFLAVDVTKPPTPPDFATWRNSQMAAFHLAAAKAQLVEVRAAMALAVALNRTLIMPALYCFCDRYWHFMTHCHAETSDFPLPFVCPLDHLLSVERLAEAAPYGGEAAPLAFREHSFLQNPRVPKRVTAGAVEVAVAGGGNGGTGQGPRRVTLPRQVTDMELVRQLEPHAEVPLLRVLGSPSALFGGFSDARAAALLEARFMTSLDQWCCFRSVSDHPDTVTEDGQVHSFAADFAPAAAATAARRATD